MATETWQVVAGASAAVAAVAAAASAIAAWRSSALTLQVTREVRGEAEGGDPLTNPGQDGESPKRRTWRMRLHNAWSRLASFARRSRRTPRLKYDGYSPYSNHDTDFDQLLHDKEALQAHLDKGIGFGIRIINTSECAAHDVDVEVLRGDDVLGREFVDHIDPIPSSATVTTRWIGCQFLPSRQRRRTGALDRRNHPGCAVCRQSAS